MKVITIVGARPQFIKAAPVSRALRRKGCQEIILHTGQHYDYQMSQVFFDQLGIAKPDYDLGVGSGPHGWQTAQMLVGIESILRAETPDWVLVFGDTNSTLAAALAATKLRIPLAHVEAGLRSYNRAMPEEHNRVLTDHCSDVLFCPTKRAVQNLEKEGILQEVIFVGDTMYDAVLSFIGCASRSLQILADLRLEPHKYLLITVHRPANTDVRSTLFDIFTALGRVSEPVVFPVHPRTKEKIHDMGLPFDRPSTQLKLIEPVSYLEMLTLEQNARLILTDSGGIQKEAFFLGVPCLTLRKDTEWMETVESGANRLVGTDPVQILEAVKASYDSPPQPMGIFGAGDAARRIATWLCTPHDSFD